MKRNCQNIKAQIINFMRELIQIFLNKITVKVNIKNPQKNNLDINQKTHPKINREKPL